jgi:hypothetical protein
MWHSVERALWMAYKSLETPHVVLSSTCSQPSHQVISHEFLHVPVRFFSKIIANQ